MKLCINCQKFGACESASEETTECKGFKKFSLETEITRKLVKVDGLNYKFEEVK